MEESIVKVKHLSHRYSVQWAIKDINFEIKNKGTLGLLGSNGAGKSTTMNMITGYIGPTEGSIMINGHDMLENPEEAKKCIGYLPEIPPLYPDLRVREYLTFVAELKKVERAKRDVTVHKIMGRTGTLDVSERLIKNLSKGYRQRVGLAQAVLGFPEIIILDEPSVGLDPKQIIEIRELIRKLAKKHTVILSSHILAEVREVCDYIMIISKGKLVASDTPENLERYLGESGLIEIETRTEASKVKEVLKNVPGIEKVSLKTDASGITSGQIREKRGQDIREELFTTFAEKKMPLLKLNPVQVSLEDVFMELTQSDKAAEEFARKAKEAEKEEVSNAGDL